MNRIPIYDLKADYHSHKTEIDRAVLACMERGRFIGGEQVTQFEQELAQYLGVPYVISCGNGTDALQLALMALDLPKGSKIIVPAFTYIATIEVICLLGFEPIYADVDPFTFNITLEEIQKVFTSDVKAIIVVHLFGQVVDEIEAINQFCTDQHLFLIEDNAQALGAEKKNTRNTICTTSFFPTKNLGAYGDGGAVYTHVVAKAEKIRRIANHGQTQKYIHDEIGINSRLDALQASILRIKLSKTDEAIFQKQKTSLIYDECFKNIAELQIPVKKRVHTFHQYTLKVEAKHRDKLKQQLHEKNIESVVYYPLPAYRQKAYLQNINLAKTELLCKTVLSIPIHPYLSDSEIHYICDAIRSYFKPQQ